MDKNAAVPGSVNLSQKGALVLLSTSQWTARKLDREETRKVCTDNGASPEAARVNKSLIPGDDLIKAIAKNISTFRQDYHYTVTLPWGDDGWRLIPATRIGEYRATFRKHEDVHNDLVARMVAQYSDKVENANLALGSLFKHSDYPSPAEIAGKYRFGLDWNSISDADDLRVKISEDMAQEIRQAMADSTKAKVAGAVRDTYSRVHDVVGKLVDRLTADSDGDSKIFRDSLIGNVRDLIDVLPSLNITDDAKLAGIVDKLHGKLAGLSAEDLRPSKKLSEEAVAETKADVLKTAQEVLADLQGVF